MAFNFRNDSINGAYNPFKQSNKNIHMNKKDINVCNECQSDKVANVKINSKLSYRCCKMCGHCDLNISSNTMAFNDAQKKYFSENLQTLTSFSTNQLYKDNKFKLSILGKYFNKPGKVIEVGPGVGLFADLLVKDNHEVTVIEHSRELVRLLLEKAKYTVHEGEFESMFIGCNEFDLFVSLHVIEHVVDPFQHLSKAFDLIKPGGYALIATPNARSWQQRLFPLLSPNFDSAHLRVYSLDSLKSACKRSGWKVIYQHTPETGNGWLRIFTKILRKVRKEDEELTAGRYSAQASQNLSYLISLFSLISWPLRIFQEKCLGGNEIIIICQKKI